jgi:3-methyl-2-oxobutanoate hydroxymethyltransferase
MKIKEKMTVPKIIEKKNQGEKICCLTAYDRLFASLLDSTELDIILVGDSVSMVSTGYKTTLPITMDEMIYHTRAVSRGIERALLIADMPFMSFQVNPEETLKNAGRFLKEGRAEGVKIEGGQPVVDSVKKLVDVGIPVMGHLGLTPQSIWKFGGYRVRGKSSDEAQELKRDAKFLEQAGVFAIVLEKIPAALAEQITKSVSIPTIGIGSGPHCDGQILVTYDMLGLFKEFKPKFVRQYADLGQKIQEAVKRYSEDVKNGNYPAEEESY